MKIEFTKAGHSLGQVLIKEFKSKPKLQKIITIHGKKARINALTYWELADKWLGEYTFVQEKSKK